MVCIEEATHMSETLDIQNLPPVLSVKQAAEVIGVGRLTMYDMTRRPGFPALRHGRRILIPRDALFQWLEREAWNNDGTPCGATSGR
jgi:excisionase family DNA binding protein